MELMSDNDIASNRTESLLFNAVSLRGPLSTGASSGLMDDQNIRSRSCC